MSYHPEDLMLKSYVEGELDAVSALTIAVHIETCPECKRKVALFEQELGLKSILMGFGLNSDSIHSPDEHFGLFNYYKGIETIPHFFKHFTALSAQ